MAAEKGNTYAQKHSVEHICAVLEDVIAGMQCYEANQSKQKSDELDVNITQRKGYSCLERGLFANGHYSMKLVEWEETHKDNEKVSILIKKARQVSRDMLYINTIEGHYDKTVGIFMCKAKLGMVEKGEADKVETMKSLMQVQFVEAGKK